MMTHLPPESPHELCIGEDWHEPLKDHDRPRRPLPVRSNRRRRKKSIKMEVIGQPQLSLLQLKTEELNSSRKMKDLENSFSEQTLLTEASSSSDSRGSSSGSESESSLSQIEAKCAEEVKETETKKKKKKKHKKHREKSEKDTSTKTKKKKKKGCGIVVDNDDDDTVVTEQDEKAVEELCNVLSDTLSSSPIRESFIQMLHGDKKINSPSAQHDCWQGQHQMIGGRFLQTTYSALQSPEPSECGSIVSQRSQQSLVHSYFPDTGDLFEGHHQELWTPVDPPSVCPIPDNEMSSSFKALRKASKRVSRSSESEPAIPQAMNFQKQKCPEDLFHSLPPEFRAFLLDLHEGEEQIAKPEDYVPSSPFLIQKPRGTRHKPELTIVDQPSNLQRILRSEEVSCPLSPEDVNDDSSDNDDSESSEAKDLEEDDEQAFPMPKLRSRRDMLLPRSSLLWGLRQGTEESPQTKRVRFDSVHIFEFDTVMDVNPACTCGAAIALGWYMISNEKLCIDDYDKYHRHRRLQELILPWPIREGILRRLGYSREEIEDTAYDILIARKQRRRTIQSVRLQKFEYAMEKVGRHVKHLMGHNKRKAQK